MIQSGILYTINSTTGQATNKPLKGAWINFVQNDVIKVRTQTHSETGAYSVDVPFGKYTVNLAVGNVTVTMRAGQLFELKSGDNASAFQNWLYSKSGDIDDALLKSFKDIADAVNRDRTATENAKNEMVNNSVGNAGGKWLKEGAGGILGSTIRNTKISDNAISGLYTSSDAIEEVKLFPNDFNYNILLLGYQHDRMNGIAFNPVGHFAYTYASNNKSLSMIYNEHTARKDKNNVLHATTSTPKDTMLVGDFGVGLVRSEHITFPAETSNDDRLKYVMSKENGIYRMIGSVGGAVFARNPAVLVMHSSDMDTQICSMLALDMYRNRAAVAFRAGANSPVVQGDLYTTLNTTVDSNGNIKKASPVIKLFDDHIEWNQDFKEEPVFEKLGIGVYKISNTNGLARGIVHGDWYIETPKNRNGLPYFMVEWEQDAITDDVIIKTFKRKFDINIGDFVNGEPRDIGKDERWIDLRFHEQIYALVTNRTPRDINVPYRELWGIEPYIPPIVEPIEEDIALEDQRAF